MAKKEGFYGMDCRVKGCSRPVMIKKRRLCGGHYGQYTRGEKLRRLARSVPIVNADGRKTSIEEYLEEYIRRSDKGCWVWTGNISRNGYGLMSGLRMGKKGKVFAHRVAWAIHNGFKITELPARLSIDHICRNRACVNPAHLTLMTVAKNLGNMLAWHTLLSAKKLYDRECNRLQKEIVQLESQLDAKG